MNNVIIVSILLGWSSLGAQALCLNLVNTTLLIVNGNQMNSSVIVPNTQATLVGNRSTPITTERVTESSAGQHEKYAESKGMAKGDVSMENFATENLLTLSILYENQINSSGKVPVATKPVLEMPARNQSTPLTTEGPSSRQHGTHTNEEVKKEVPTKQSTTILSKTDFRSSFPISSSEETTFDHKHNETDVTFDHLCNTTDPESIQHRLSPTLLKVLTRQG